MSSPIASTSRQVLSCAVSRGTARRFATSAATPAPKAAAAATAAAAGASSSEEHVTASLLLSRPPRILRTPHPFESAYFSYNARLQRALAQPFPKDFYFKRGSAAERRFEQEEAARRAGQSASSAVAGKQGDAGKESKQESAAAAAAAPPPPAAAAEEVGEQEHAPLPRTTKADETGDVKSLDRALDRTLFLLVKNQGKAGGWTLPSTKVSKESRSESGSETLHLKAPSAVTKLLGESMDIWMINHLPVGVLPLLEAGTDKTYVMRAHILAGQASESSSVDYAWLTREEVQQHLSANKALPGLDALLSQ